LSIGPRAHVEPTYGFSLAHGVAVKLQDSIQTSTANFIQLLTFLCLTVVGHIQIY